MTFSEDLAKALAVDAMLGMGAISPNEGSARPQPRSRWIRMATSIFAEAVEGGHFIGTLGAEFSLDQLQRQLASDGYG
jgi:hypothetical protein